MTNLAMSALSATAPRVTPTDGESEANIAAKLLM
jgi:hypothetical protein